MSPATVQTKHSMRNGGIDVTSKDDMSMIDRVYLDGSCDTHAIKELRRAAFAVVTLGDDLQEESVYISTVPGTMPQTAQAAEFCAATCGSQLLHGPSILVGDCENVIRNWRRDADTQSRTKQAYGGLARHESRGKVVDFIKVKAHLTCKQPRHRVLRKSTNSWSEMTSLTNALTKA